MTELEQAVAKWRESYHGSGLDRPPLLWVGHWAAEGWLGAIWDSNPDDQASAYYMASPFAFSSQVMDTFIVQVRQRQLQVTKLARTGAASIQITGWRLTFEVDDGGRISKVSLIEKQNDLNSWIDRLCRFIGQARLERNSDYTFDHALQAAIEARG